MFDYVVGIDPDNNKNGVAVYKNRQLTSLFNWDFGECYKKFAFELDEKGLGVWNTLIFIEDGNLIKATYDRNKRQDPKEQSTISTRIGINLGTASCLISMLQAMGYKVFPMRPDRHNWADEEAKFKAITRWDKRSNPETRSAAYFGYLGLNEARKLNGKQQQETVCHRDFFNDDHS